ncbi:MAG: hypothetical protein V3U27_14390 [Candidatus Tectomicrobia bacterium]
MIIALWPFFLWLWVAAELEDAFGGGGYTALPPAALCSWRS